MLGFDKAQFWFEGKYFYLTNTKNILDGNRFKHTNTNADHFGPHLD